MSSRSIIALLMSDYIKPSKNDSAFSSWVMHRDLYARLEIQRPDFLCELNEAIRNTLVEDSTYHLHLKCIKESPTASVNKVLVVHEPDYNEISVSLANFFL